MLFAFHSNTAKDSILRFVVFVVIIDLEVYLRCDPVNKKLYTTFRNVFLWLLIMVKRCIAFKLVK